MEEILFSITCTTCQARLAVRNEASIGAILACPKCGSMVQVTPPPQWEPQQPGTTAAAGPAESAAAAVGAGPSAGASPEAVHNLDAAGVRASRSELLWRKWLLVAAAPVAAVVVVLGVWSILFSSGPSEAGPDAEARQPAEPPPTQQPTTQQQPTQQPPTPAQVLEYPPQRPKSGLPEPEPKEPAQQPVEPDVEPDQTPPPDDTPKPPDDTPKPPDDAPKLPPARPAVQVDVEARLADTFDQLELRDVPLAEAVDLLAAMSTLPISFDPEAMQQLGVTLRDPVTVRLSQATVGKALEAILSRGKLAYVVHNGQVLITTDPSRRETFRKIRYTVSDLTGEDPAAMAELAALVRKLVAPDSWRAGGRATIEPRGGALVVTQTGAVHYQLLVFCEKLRNARGKPLRSRLDPDRFTLATRLDRAGKLLGRPVAANFHEPTPLATVVAYLEELTGANILIDRPALGAAGLSAEMDCTLNVHKQTLATALAELLRPLGLVYRAVDAGTLQVTTRETADARLELEFYPMARLLAKGHTGAALVERIKSKVGASVWREAGGSGVAHFDQPSGCLIVLQSQPVQAAIGRLLAEKPAPAN